MIYKKCSKFPLSLFLGLFILACFASTASFAEETHYKPFVLGSTDSNTDINAVVESVRKKLTSNGFEVVGSYSPYENATILVVTSPSLKQNAAASDFGVFGAIQRVAVTKTDKGMQISYTNPIYMANVYRMKSDLTDVTAALTAALGHEKEFGSEKGKTKAELREYHYKFLMPYFDDRLNLASYSDYAAAMKVVEKNLQNNKPKVSQVYRVDLPEKQETIIGLKMPGVLGTECSGDKYIMSRIDFKDVKSTAHLPYEIVISKGKVVGLPAEFRIAINFPDLSMMGDNSFMSIMCAPDAFKAALSAVAGGDL
jgi:uncharacterized protein (DUF302 family)